MSGLNALIPLLEAFINRHPDVKVDFRIRDIIGRQQATETRSILLQHVSMIFPATAVCEHLHNKGRNGLKIN